MSNNYIGDHDSGTPYITYLSTHQAIVGECIDLHRAIITYIDSEEFEIDNPIAIVNLLKSILRLPFGEEDNDNEVKEDDHIVRPLQCQFEPKFQAILECVVQSENREIFSNMIRQFYHKYFEVIDPLDYYSIRNMKVRQWKEVWNEYIS